MTEKAHVLTHRARWDEALGFAEAALAIDPDCTNALDVAAEVYLAKEDRARLLDATGRYLRLMRPRVRRPFWATGQHIRAKIEPGRFEAAAKDIERLAGWSSTS
jgi:hypothetical protein